MNAAPFALAGLEDQHVALEPLRVDHAEGLAAALTDGELWRLWFTGAPRPEAVGDYIAAALQNQAQGRMLPYAVREKRTGAIVGSTRYYDLEADPRRVAIGYTWYARTWQKGHVNTACKRLLLAHAFERFGCVAVTFHTDGRNLDSQRAIERLGAQREGVLRQHKRRPDGSLRDTVCFSILDREWPDVARWLALRLERLADRQG